MESVSPKNEEVIEGFVGMEHLFDLSQRSYAHADGDGDGLRTTDHQKNIFSRNNLHEELIDDPIYDSSQDTKDSAESNGRVTASKNSDDSSEDEVLFSDDAETADTETKANEMDEEIDELLFVGQKCSFEVKDVDHLSDQAEGNESSRQIVIESSSVIETNLITMSWIQLRILKFSEALSILLYIITIIFAAEDLGKGKLIEDSMKGDPWNKVIMNDQSMNVFDLNNNLRIIAIYIITLCVVQIFTTIFELPILLHITKRYPNSSVQKYGINIIIAILLNKISHSGAILAKYLMIFDALIFMVEYFGIDA